MKPAKPITDRTFHYRNSASHDDGGQSFRRRMHARKRLADRRARQQSTNVAPLDAKRKAKA
jgi:hypothetical protein